MSLASAGTWLSLHALQLIQSLGILGSLMFAGIALRNTGRAQRMANRFHLAEQQRKIWGEQANQKELRRVLRPDADLSEEPMTEDERRFLTSAILHLGTTFEARRTKTVDPIEGLDRDAAWLLSLPLPRARWSEMKDVQNRSFVEYADRLLSGQPPSSKRWLTIAVRN